MISIAPESLDALAARLEDLIGADPTALRRDLEALQAEALGLGRPELADALGRLALLTEVGECLDPDASAEVAAFCAGALARLASGPAPARSRRRQSSASRPGAGATTSG
jgi:hypothetical protein